MFSRFINKIKVAEYTLLAGGHLSRVARHSKLQDLGFPRCRYILGLQLMLLTPLPQSQGSKVIERGEIQGFVGSRASLVMCPPARSHACHVQCDEVW